MTNTHAFHARKITNDNLVAYVREYRAETIAAEGSKNTCDVCGGSKTDPVHYTPKALNPFPLYAGTPMSRRD